ncbi:MAG: carboxypeptidase regulatory-like domain-containing protein [Verrucomicrobiales bacterium]|nr:carboxypeptidase regulatory-like domain-containing protein [Verrucomicrobiales bacterium]
MGPELLYKLVLRGTDLDVPGGGDLSLKERGMKGFRLTHRMIASAIIGACFLVDTLSPWPQQTQSGSLKGVLVNELTGEPIRHGVVLLAQADEKSASAAGAETPQERKVHSGSDGSFVFEQLDPGLYKLRAEHPAFLTRTFRLNGAPFIEVSPETPKESLRFTLTPRGAITGRILDQEGYDITGAQVVVLRYGWSRGKRVIQGVRAPQAVDDRGEFRVGNLEPGRYTLYATMVGKAVRTDDGMSYVKTYYPSAHQLSEAGSISVQPGAEANITIRLQRKRTFRVDGQIVNASTGEAVVDNPMFIQLHPQEEVHGDSGSPPMVQFSKYGSFEFSDVLPGSYVIQPSAMAFLNVDTGVKVIAEFAGRHEVVVSDEDLTDLSVPLRLATTVVGRLVPTEDDEPSENKFNATVYISPLYSGGSSFQARTDGAGAFEMQYVWPGRYRVVVSGLPDGNYLKSVHFGRQEAADGSFEVLGGEGFVDLQLTISPEAASVSGSVRWKGSGSAQGTEFVVTLAPRAVELASEPLLFRHVSTSPAGDFSIPNLAPGDYTLSAWEEVNLDAAMSPEFRGHFSAQSVTVSLTESSQESVSLSPISSDSVVAVEARLQ